MSPQYILKVLTHFASAHTLRDYPGECSRFHGHNWKIEVEVSCTQLDETGMGIDFKRIKDAANTVAKKLDHRYLNEVAPFDKINPTAENIACYLYTEIAKIINTDSVQISSVVLWETDRACVRYSEK